ncbi:MAG: hypothetical protein M3018_00005 [Actinomycetota bacterium]|nr:hypothetical protein [Actinomycetota bacterium]
MVTTELASPALPRPTPTSHIRQVVLLWGGLWAITLMFAVLSLAWPALAPAGRPHPTLHPTLAAVSSIFRTNARVLAVPFVLVLSRFGSGRRSRSAGDAILALTIGTSAATVGLVLGHTGSRLLPYIPQLPVEYAAAAVAAAVWIAHRRDCRAREIARFPSDRRAPAARNRRCARGARNRPRPLMHRRHSLLYSSTCALRCGGYGAAYGFSRPEDAASSAAGGGSSPFTIAPTGGSHTSAAAR